MNPFAKNGLAIIAGIVAGSAINLGIIMISGYFIPPPAGTDLTSMESLSASMHLFEPKHFIMPFLAHAGGTFAGAWVAGKLSASMPMRYALIIGLFFLAGGIINVYSLPSPFWFNITDLIFAYIPTAWLAGKLAGIKQV